MKATDGGGGQVGGSLKKPGVVRIRTLALMESQIFTLVRNHTRGGGGEWRWRWRVEGLP